jgi:hypothetical protein
VSSLRTLVSLVEPVKNYDRGGLQVWGSQLVPLVGLADAAKPESEPSREFAASVDRMLFAQGGIDRARAAQIAENLDRWATAGSEVADALAGTYPALREAVLPARALVEACAVGGDAVHALGQGVPTDPATLQADLARLGHACLPNGSATLLPIVAPVRLLVAAAARQGERAALSDEQWRTLVLSTASPAPADGAHAAP